MGTSHIQSKRKGESQRDITVISLTVLTIVFEFDTCPGKTTVQSRCISYNPALRKL